jgi:feruloyl esterase
VNFEVWLPASGWNGKFLGVGNAGLGGSISYDAMVSALTRGYATASTDTGHIGTGNAPGQYARWALGHPELIVDHAYRAIHEMTVKGKAIVEAFYAERPRISYFTGCSTGGRQGLLEAQRFATDYDGIVAVSPVNFYTHLYGSMLWIRHAARKDPASALSNDKLALVNEAVLTACDDLDGVRDGVMEDPRRCKFDPAALQCKTTNPDRCLTAAQIETVKRIYSPATNPRTGGEIFPGLAPGGELGWNFLAGPNPFSVPVDFMKYFVFNDPDWDWRSFDFDKDMALLDSKFAAMFNATEPTLADFRKHGGKIILVHGWSDPTVSPFSSINYYNSVQKAIGEGSTKTDFRLFMAPGMAHCGGGPGPSAFDHLAAITEWVEGGKAPDKLIVSSRPTNSGLVRTRALCPYPQVAQYKGSGNTDNAANFVCAAATP